ncbi:MAG TPA: pyruvate kinase [Planctomycetes bacterium]|nr:pyruvate kinase [Planctomycetota bacterium]
METPSPRLDLTRRFCQLGRAHARIVATIGPGSEGILRELVEAGMSVARLNFSHGTAEDHRRRVEKIRAVSEELSTPIGILADLPGPKLRLGTIPEEASELHEGDRVRLMESPGPLPPGRIPLPVEGIEARLEPGHRVILADGAVELLVMDPDNSEGIPAEVRRGGVVGTRKGIHLPDTDLEQTVPTAEDVEGLALARELDVDFIGVSFVGEASELEKVRALAPDALLVAKIERALALTNIEEILAATDGIMVARGDLGVEMELEEIPTIQKSLLQLALRAGCFTITATEMLESMVTSSRPTRAEVTDVANAILDGTDAVMLSAETAVGDHPQAAVEAMDRIARAVEASQYYQDLPKVGFRASESTFSNAAALAAAQAADALGIAKIICFTKTGNTVRLLSRYRPHAEIVALSPDPRTLTHMTILAHVRPVRCPQLPTLEDMLEGASRDLLARGIVQTGEQVVFVAGVPPGVASSTNVLKLHCIGDPIKLA